MSHARPSFTAPHSRWASASAIVPTPSRVPLQDSVKYTSSDMQVHIKNIEAIPLEASACGEVLHNWCMSKRVNAAYHAMDDMDSSSKTRYRSSVTFGKYSIESPIFASGRKSANRIAAKVALYVLHRRGELSPEATARLFSKSSKSMDADGRDAKASSNEHVLSNKVPNPKEFGVKDYFSTTAENRDANASSDERMWPTMVSNSKPFGIQATLDSDFIYGFFRMCQLVLPSTTSSGRPMVVLLRDVTSPDRSTGASIYAECLVNYHVLGKSKCFPSKLEAQRAAIKLATEEVERRLKMPSGKSFLTGDAGVFGGRIQEAEASLR
ncbi:hypothetical protein DFJ73DRAFT_85529 [Zopfochytrium polystomum]|nr:hypothetical protein DFJ73DRAFT_85529 [Zopfochytrium polystomum]